MILDSERNIIKEAIARSTNKPFRINDSMHANSLISFPVEMSVDLYIYV